MNPRCFREYASRERSHLAAPPADSGAKFVCVVGRVQAPWISRSTLPDQGHPCVLCLATPAPCAPMAMWPSEGYCVLSRVLSDQVRLHVRCGLPARGPHPGPSQPARRAQGPRGRRAPEARGAEATTWSAACWRARTFRAAGAAAARPRRPPRPPLRPRRRPPLRRPLADGQVFHHRCQMQERGGWLRHDRGGWSVRFFGGFEWLQPIEEDGTAS
ncbi:unnamed protein product [Prorocentrum cordatum]|uniref:Uncharacterized protein n=1 Tax=Prorocentrum cordatum TaxID=2364126 RepID=A0ABN9W924_9DINO|nr:unnamed protein product [Polarella glacialis]